MRRDLGSAYLRMAPIFRSIPDHERITLAWADAGTLPYYSDLRSMDLVGLNTNEIAHANSAREVIGFVLAARPDMMIIPLDLNLGSQLHSCRNIFRQGHGLIGTGYLALARAALASTYKPIAMMPQTIYDLDLLADTTSPHYRDIVNTIAPRIGHDPDFLPPIESIR